MFITTFNLNNFSLLKYEVNDNFPPIVTWWTLSAVRNVSFLSFHIRLDDTFCRKTNWTNQYLPNAWSYLLWNYCRLFPLFLYTVINPMVRARVCCIYWFGWECFILREIVRKWSWKRSTYLLRIIYNDAIFGEMDVFSFPIVLLSL